MLKHFTWQQFLIAALILNCIWYAVVILVFYRQWFLALLKGRASGSPLEPLRRPWDEELEEEPPAEDDDLMGKSAMPEGMSRLSMAQFGFAPRADEATFDSRRELQLGLLPDVLEELKSIFHTLETQQGTKEDFISLFGLIKAKYRAVADTPNREAVNGFIRANVLFPISDEELDNLWN